MPDLEFRKVDASNYRDVLKLEVAENQKNFVAPNERSLLQSAYEAPDDSIPYGIYAGDVLAGFLLVTTDNDSPDTLWVWRLMIDKAHQGKGYGKATMQKLKADTITEGKYKKIALSYMPDNAHAAHVYTTVGFVEEGVKEEWGEMVATCDLATENS